MDTTHPTSNGELVISNLGPLTLPYSVQFLMSIILLIYWIAFLIINQFVIQHKPSPNFNTYYKTRWIRIHFLFAHTFPNVIVKCRLITCRLFSLVHSCIPLVSWTFVFIRDFAPNKSNDPTYKIQKSKQLTSLLFRLSSVLSSLTLYSNSSFSKIPAGFVHSWARLT